MNHIAMLLPKEDLVSRAQVQASGHDAIAEIRCITTERAVEEAEASIRRGAVILIARGLQALRIRSGLNVPVVSVRLTAQGIGMLLRKARQFTDKPCPRVALVVVQDMLRRRVRKGQSGGPEYPPRCDHRRGQDGGNGQGGRGRLPVFGFQ